MGLRSTEVIQILKHLIGGQIKNSPLGYGVTCSPRAAFILSALTGATYFDSHIFPFTPRGLMKVFNSVNEYKIVNGLFDGKNIVNSPICYVGKKDYLFHGLKLIVPVEFDSEQSLRQIFREAYGDEDTDPNILILKIEVSKKGHGLEPLMEYIASQFYSAKGYITETQLPLSHALGSPDFFACSDNKIQSNFRREGFFYKGFNMIELTMLSTFRDTPLNPGKVEKISDEFIVGEVKTSTTSMEKQIRKYCSSGIFTSAIEIHPTKSTSSTIEFGLLNLRDNAPKLTLPERNADFSNIQEVKKFKPWFEAYLKAYLIGNYSQEDLPLLYRQIFNRSMSTKNDLICLIRDVPLEVHLHLLNGYLSNGCLERRIYQEGNHPGSRS